MKILRSVLRHNTNTHALDSYNYLVDVGYIFDITEDEVFTFIQEFYNRNEDLPSYGYTLEHFRTIQRKEIVDFLKDMSDEPEYTFVDMKDYVDKIMKEKKDAGFIQLLKTTQSIHKHGETIEKNVLKGRKDALEYLFARVSDYEDTTDGKNHEPYNVVTEVDAMWDKYKAEEGNPVLSYGLTTGFWEIDEIIRGSKRGHVVLTAGFTSNGKTMFTLNYLYNIVFILRRDAILYTLEMSEDEVAARLYSIHSAHPKFVGLGSPIPFQGLLDRCLTPEQNAFFENHVKQDIKDNKDTYGTLLVDYPTEDFTVGKLKASLLSLKKKLDLEAFSVDYPELMEPEKGKRGTGTTETLNEILKSLKRLCSTFDGGKGLLGIFPFQISRDGYEKAKKNNGVPLLSSLSYANQAERISDLVYALYKDTDNPDVPELLISCIKNRHGKMFQRVKLSTIWASCYMSNAKQDESLDLKDYVWDL